MTLFKQITLLVSALILVMLTTVMVKNFQTANEFIQEQLYTDAQDTATSLGLSLSTVVDKEDISTMETMINSIFDSGYYEEITLVDTDGNTLYTRLQPPVVKNVPQWFIGFIDFEAPRAQTRINDGWMPFAELYVKSHSGHAYFKLWNTLKDIGTLFIIIGFIALLIIYILLKIVLNSLKKLQEQAEAISSNDFIIQEKMPFTTEIRYITVVMNKMVTKVKSIFEKEAEAVKQYHELLYKDTLTGLSNRRYFIMQFADQLSSESVDSDGTLLLVSLEGMEMANTLIGHQKVDALIRSFAEILRERTNPEQHELAARLNGTEFAILLHDDSDIVSAVAGELLNTVKELFETSGLDTKATYITIGLCAFQHGDTFGNILANADYAVSSAKQSGPFISAPFDSDRKEESAMGKQEWMDAISAAMDEKRIRLAAQPVMIDNTQQRIYHLELFMRFEERSGEIRSAGYFMPVINRLGLHSQIDKYVIEQAVAYAREHQEHPLALNISAPFIKESSNLQWLDNVLQELQKEEIDGRFYFELSNHDVIYNLEACLSLYRVLKSYGHHVGIDKFTGEAKDFDYLQKIKPAYVKIDKAYISDMIHNESTGLTNESFNIMIESLDIKAIATAIETAEEKASLQKAQINYLQGAYIAPTSLI